MRYKAVIFDLDGTLVDSLQDLTNAMNFALQKYGYPQHTKDECKLMVGNGLRNFCKRALPQDSQEVVDDLMRVMKGQYSNHFLDNTRPFKGIKEALDAIKGVGVSMAVETNKDENIAREIVKGIFGSNLFRTVRGGNNGIPVKPSPLTTLEILNEMQLKCSEVLFVGDSDVDINTAKAAGIVSVAVTWGLRAKNVLEDHCPDHIIDKPAQLLELLT